MARLVVDPSAVLALALTDESADYADRVLEAIGTDGAVVPSIFWYEIRNVLLMAERRQRLTSDQTAVFLEELGHVGIATAAHPPPESVIQLARRHQLTLYDAAYLELALRSSLPLATLDRALAAAAKRAEIPVFSSPAS